MPVRLLRLLLRLLLLRRLLLRACVVCDVEFYRVLRGAAPRDM